MLAPISAAMRLRVLWSMNPPLPHHCQAKLPRLCHMAGLAGGSPSVEELGLGSEPTSSDCKPSGPLNTALYCLSCPSCLQHVPHAHTRTCMHTGAHTDTHRCTHRQAQMHTDTHRCTHRQAQMHTDTHRYTQMHTNRHTHTHVLSTHAYACQIFNTS